MHHSRLLLVALTALVVGGWNVRTARAEDQQPPSIRVRGQGVVTARPDVAFLTIGASVRRETAGEAFERAETLIAALTDTLKVSGVLENDIQTRQFNLGPEFGRGSDNNPPPIIGWRATHTVTAKLRDFGRIGRTIDDAVNALGNEAVVQGISFTIEDTDALAARARAEAIANARTKAEDLAARAGVRLGKVLQIVEVSSPGPTPVPAAAPAGEARAVAASAQISPGEQTISVIVDVVYAIDAL